jgi:hypothetical protein
MSPLKMVNQVGFPKFSPQTDRLRLSRKVSMIYFKSYFFFHLLQSGEKNRGKSTIKKLDEKMSSREDCFRSFA